jgi:hypothetical protein
MTIQQFDVAHRARPFRPFTLHMADGRAFRVPHPEFASRSPSGRTVVVQGGDDNLSVLDLLLLTEIEFEPAVASGGSAA